MEMFLKTFMEKKSELLSLMIEHIQLTFLAVAIAIIIAVPLGIMITKNKKVANAVIGIANLIQAIPSLAILGFLIPVLGIGAAPAICMVVLYSMLPILKNTYTAIGNISPNTIEAARGVGMTTRQILFHVKIPLAIPVIMAGIRISAVTSVGLMTIAAFIGAGGLGYLVFSGIQTVNSNLILLGAIPAALLALVIDFMIGKIEEFVTPNGLQSSTTGTKKRSLSQKTKKYIISAVGILVVVFLTVEVVQSLNKKEVITVGSKNYTEQLILGNMVADLLEEHTDLEVERQMNLGGSGIIFDAMKSDNLDVYVEYTGTMYVNILGYTLNGQTAEQIYDELKTTFKEEYDMELLQPLGFNNTYTLSVAQEFAKEHNLKTISDLAAISSSYIASPTIEFANREDGLLGLQTIYDLRFNQVLPIDGALRYTALINDESQVIDAFSTDGLLKKFNLVVLEDDQNVFPAYHGVPVVRGEILDKYPEISSILNELAGKISDEMMRDLNYLVDVEQQDPAKVAHQFLVEQGYLN